MADQPEQHRKSKHHGDKKKKKSSSSSSKDKDKASSDSKDKRRSRKDGASSSAQSHTANADPLALHKAAFKNDLDTIRALLDAENPHNHRARIDELDGRGNAPLHIAAHFSYNDLVDLLLANNANPEVLSKAGWRPLEEAIATGARQVAETLMKAGHAKYRHDMEANAAKWHQQLSELPDFYMELHWDFAVLGGWVPFVSSFIPNDVYKIWKRGSAVRMDYSLTGFKSFRITRGHVSFVFTGQEQPVPGHLYVLDHDRKTRQDFCELPGAKYEKQIDDALNYVFSHDICSHLPLSADDPTHTVDFVARTGWFSGAVTEDVHGVKATVFNTHGCQFRSLIRSDPHAKQTRIPRSLQAPELFEQQMELFDTYFDLEQPDPFSVTEKPDGFTWPTENVTRKIKKFEGSLWMAPEFPLSVKQFLSLIEVYSPTNQAIKQLSEFLSQNIPEGFPVKIQIPVYYLLSATVQFRNFEHTVPEPELFEIPDDYETIAEAYIGNEAREMFKSVRDSKSKGSSADVEEDD